VTLDEDHFAGTGDAWLFACALDEMLAGQVPLNSFSELVVKLAPSQRTYAFAARAGGEALP
jgi:type VI secretion system protein ImpG